ncbi:MDIS1-interacting receptor like kinase 2-like, partial [Camellia sinensis]|uniref:MDIS1-interacting receptor like kinase 2-like n=1 Tax=Camellia sinensis TaxID=4442 RepID=UPI0010365349
MGPLEKLFCLFSLVLFVALFSSTINVASASAEEANAILTRKASLQSADDSLLTSWVLPVHDSGSTNASPCNWFGVSFNLDRSVLRLNLTSSSVNVERLNSSNELVLYTNSLLGPIPTSLSNLRNLTRPYLYGNDLYGSIPPEMGNLVNLVKLYTDGNNLTGLIPSTLENLNNLTVLHFFNNSLSGSIPQKIGQLKSLQSLTFQTNNLTGSIPTSLENWGIFPNLTLIKIARNNITGGIPLGFGKLTRLEQLDLSSNRFIGEIPKEFGKLTSLEWLILAENQLSGWIPQKLKSLTKLSKLDLSTNKFSGPILVYEYLERGSLAAIFNKDDEAKELDLPKRVNIIKGVASALSYMHHDCTLAIVRRDISSNNVLIDEEYEARVSDFGTIKLLKLDSSNWSAFASTYSYVAE